MRILFLIRTLSYGGAERQLAILAAELCRRGHTVRVLTFYPGGALESDLKGSRVQIDSLRKRGRWDAVSFAVRLTRYVRQFEPDILHTYLEGANVVSALLRPLFSAPRLVWGVRGSAVDSSKYDALSRFFLNLERRLSRRADRIIANSHAGKTDFLLAGFPHQLIDVIPNGIDTERFKSQPQLRAAIRSKWKVNDNHLVIGRVGRLVPMKGDETFLQTVSILHSDRSDLRFIWIGTADDRIGREFKDRAAELGVDDVVQLLPAVDDMRSVYSGMDVLVSSSDFGEGFPNVVAEAMACGISCAVTDVGDCALVVASPDRVSPPKNPVALADAIRVAITRRSNQSSEADRNRILEEFSIGKLGDRTELVLKQLLAAADPGGKPAQDGRLRQDVS